jgi:voltage-gated potassium channel
VIGLVLVFREFFRAVRRAIRSPQTHALIVTTAVVVAGGSGFYVIVEGWSLIDAVYFSIVTLATIGYGDLAPTTDIAKLFTIFYVLIGIGLIASTVATIANATVEVGQERRARKLANAAPSSDAGVDQQAPVRPLVERYAARHTPGAVTGAGDQQDGGKEEVNHI